jgi:hypothetical protein
MVAIRLLLAGVLVVVSGAACGHFQPVAHHLYPGPARPATEVARLSGPVATVDGLAVPDKATLFSLLPGCHVVELQPRIGEGSVSGAWSAEIRHRIYAFEMKAGSSYEIEVHLRPGSDALGTGTVGSAKIKVVERDASGALVGTIAPVRNEADIAACRAAAEGGADEADDQQPQAEDPAPATAPAPAAAPAPGAVPVPASEGQQEELDQR